MNGRRVVRSDSSTATGAISLVAIPHSSSPSATFPRRFITGPGLSNSTRELLAAAGQPRTSGIRASPPALASHGERLTEPSHPGPRPRPGLRSLRANRRVTRGDRRRPGWQVEGAVGIHAPSEGDWSARVRAIDIPDRACRGWHTAILHAGTARHTRQNGTAAEAVGWAERLVAACLAPTGAAGPMRS